MSGGSFQYLYAKSPANDGYLSDLERMADTVKRAGTPGHEEVLATLSEHVDLVRSAYTDLQASHDKASDLMHAIEWWCSADWVWSDVLRSAGIKPVSMAHEFESSTKALPDGVSKITFDDGSTVSGRTTSDGETVLVVEV